MQTYLLWSKQKHVRTTKYLQKWWINFLVLLSPKNQITGVIKIYLLFIMYGS